MNSREDIRAALVYVPATDRDTWLRMGMAVKSELGEDGFDLWDEWSQRDDSYVPRDARDVWRSITPTGKVTLGTLIHEAKRNGYAGNGSHRPVPTKQQLAQRAGETRTTEKREAKKHADAAALAISTWKAALQARADHPYLQRKEIPPVITLHELPAPELSRLIGYTPKQGDEPLGGRVLIAPVRIDEWSSLEFIDESGRKSALAGGAKSAGFFFAQKSPKGDGEGLTLLLAEGVATAISAKVATGHAAFAALASGNLTKAAKTLRGEYAKARIVVLADVGKGERDASLAARAVAGLVARPDFGDNRPADATDFNDLARMRGHEAVKQAIEAAQQPDPASTSTEHNQVPSGASVGFVSAAEWPEPEKLPAENPPVEPFSIELLPDALRPWIADIADRVQCPPDFPAVAAMVALGSVLGRKVAIFPKRHDNWHEYANLWGAIVGSPGVLKSPALFEALRPLRELEKIANSDHADAMKEWMAQKTARQIRVAAERSNALKAAKKAKDFDVAGLADLDEEDPPALRRYVVNDASVEALGEILRGNPSGTLAYRDELVGLLKQLDREGNEGARSFYLTAWAAKEAHTFDRIGRGLNLRIEGVCLSVLGSIQPSVIGEYLREAASTGGGDGLMSRFSLLTWPDINGQWRNVDRFPDSTARATASATFRAFDEIPAVADQEAGAPGDVQGLRFDDAAQDRFDGWRQQYEGTQRAGDAHPALVAHRNKYRKLVPALALICHLADEPTATAIGLRSLLRAEAWLDYIDTHAKRAYASVMQADAESARELLKRIRRRDVPDHFRLRDVYRNGWSLLSTPDQARRAAQMLADFDYLRESRLDDTGGRPTTMFTVNPRVLS